VLDLWSSGRNARMRLNRPRGWMIGSSFERRFMIEVTLIGDVGGDGDDGVFAVTALHDWHNRSKCICSIIRKCSDRCMFMVKYRDIDTMMDVYSLSLDL